MRVAIITMAYGENYGNRLQNYALQTMLNGMGVEVFTIRHQRIDDRKGLKKAEGILKDTIKSLLGLPYGKPRKLRSKRFRSFDRKNIAFSIEVFGNNTAPITLNRRYDYFIVGSDQVWNTKFGYISSNINNYLATFAAPEKRISYAASFGQDQILPEYKKLFDEELSKYKAISVRESTGVALVESCGAKAEVVLDPTMMISSLSWDYLSNKPKYADNSGFVVTYFLGGRSDAMEAHISEVANGRKVYNLETAFIPEEQIVDLDVYTTTPDEFVWLISHADCVLTDSFHGCVLSIIYHKPFVVFERLVNGKISGMESRIDTLLSIFHLEQSRDDVRTPSKTPKEADWELVENVLAKERKKSMAFLKRALDIE